MEIKTKSDFDDLIERIQEKIRLYNNHYTKDNKYKLYFSNGKSINYSITPNNIAHLLGVNIDFIRNYFNLKIGSLEALKYLVDNSYSIYKNVQDGRLSYSNIFSNYINDKLEVFEDQLNGFVDLSEIEFVCEFDSSRCYFDGEGNEYTADYYIAKKNSNNDLVLSGFIQNEGVYYLQTSQKIKNYDLNNPDEYVRLNKLFKNQVITFISSILVENYNKNYRKQNHISISDEKNILHKLNIIAKKYKAIPCTISKHLFDINGVEMNLNNLYLIRDSVTSITSCINEKKVVDIDEFEDIPSEFQELIGAYNNFVCESNISDSANSTYTELLTEYKNLKEEVTKLKSSNDELLNREKENQERISYLENKEQDYNQLKNSIFEIVEEEQQKTKKYIEKNI